MNVLLTLLANAAWQWPLIALGVFAITLYTRPHPRTAHRVWLLALCVALPMPAVTTLRTVGASPASSPTSGSAAVAQSIGRPELVPVAMAGREAAPRERARFTTSLSLPVPALAEKVCVLAWVATVLWYGMQLLVRYGAASELLATAEPMILPHTVAVAAERLCRHFCVDLPELRAAAIPSPALAGIRKPVLLVPVAFLEHTPREQEAVLAHELAHLARRDPATSFLAEVLALPLRWHPATPRALRELRRYRELATDALAAATQPSPHNYATSLLALAESMLPTDAQQSLAMPLFSTDLLEERIMQLIRPHSPATLSRRIAGIGTAVLLAGAATGAAAAFPLTLTTLQNSPAPAAPGPAVTTPAAPAADPAVATAHGMNASVEGGRSLEVHHWIGRGGQPLRAAETTAAPLTPAEQEAYEAKCREQSEAVRKEVEEATASLRSPEFRRQMAEASRVNGEAIRRQIEQSTAHLRSQEFREQMAEASRANGDALRQQAEEATASLRSPEFQRKMAEAARVNGEAIRKEVEEATASLRSPEFQKQLRDTEIEALKSRLSELERERDAQNATGSTAP